MSLISDLLSKIEQKEPIRNVPPLLKDAVLRNSSERTKRNRIFILVAILLLVTISGIMTVYSVYYKHEPLLIGHREMKPPPKAPELVSTAGLPVQSHRELASDHNIQNDDEGKRSTFMSSGPENKELRATVETVKTPSKDHKTRTRTLRTGDQMKGAKGQEKKQTEAILPPAAETIVKQDKDHYLYAARSFESEKKYQMALSNYRKILTFEPDNYVVMSNMSGDLILLGSYDESIKYAEKALRIRNDHVPSLINLGVAFSSLGKYEEGEEYFKRVISIEPSNRFALMNTALIFEKRAMYDKARDHFARLSEMGDTQGYIGLARISEKQDKTKEAINYYQAAMSLESRNSLIWNFANERLLQLMK
jgi:Tfp pilus assembly protein PilF